MANEKRLIDANALKQMFDDREAEDIELYGCHIIEGFQADDAKEIVDKMPTVDAVEVVRCKDCKSAIDYPFRANQDKLVCTKSTNWRAVEQDHFCSYGERKDNG